MRYICISFQISCTVVSDSLQPQGLRQTRPPCPSPTPGAFSNPCPLSRWCHTTISSSVVPFSSCPQSFPASGSFTMTQFFTSGGQNTGVSASASVLPMNTQDWFPLGWTGWISLQSKGLSRVFNTTGQKYQFFGAQLSLWSNSHFHSCGRLGRATLCCGMRGFSLWWLLLLQSIPFGSVGSVVVALPLSCFTACGIFPDQGWNPVPFSGRWVLIHSATRNVPGCFL